jgi:hypothetical protein
VFCRKREEFGGWASWLFFTPLPFTDDSRSDVEMCGEYGLADGCFGSNLPNYGRRQFNDGSQAILIKLAHRRAVDHPCVMQSFSSLMDRCEGGALVGFR